MAEVNTPEQLGRAALWWLCLCTQTWTFGSVRLADRWIIAPGNPVTESNKSRSRLLNSKEGANGLSTTPQKL